MRRSSSVFIRGMVPTAVILLALVLALAMPGGAPRRALAGGGEFSISVDGRAVMGGVRVTLETSGTLLENAAAAPCQGGETGIGSLTVEDGEHTFNAALTSGFATDGCIPGFSNGVFLRLSGFWDDDVLTPARVTAIGRLGEDGSLQDVVGEVTGLSGYYYYPYPYKAKRPEPRKVYLFAGRFDGQGTAQGFKLAGSGVLGGADARRLLDRLLAGEEAIDDGAADLPEEAPVAEANGRPFTLHLAGPASLGQARVTLDLTGKGTGRGEGCGTARASRGTLTIDDGKDTITGIVRNANVQGCARPSPEAARKSRPAITISVSGSMTDDIGLPFFLQASGRLDAEGRLTNITGSVYMNSVMEIVIGSPESAVDALRADIDIFAGKFTAEGRTTGLIGGVVEPPADVTTFELTAEGPAGDETLGLSVTGRVMGSDPYINLRVREALLILGTKQYVLTLRSVQLERDGSTATLLLVGSVLEDAEDKKDRKIVGVFIGELSMPDVPDNLFSEGGEADIGGRIARVRIGSRTYSPQLDGVLSVVIGPPAEPGDAR